MSEKSEIPDEMLIGMLKERGYAVEKAEETPDEAADDEERQESPEGGGARRDLAHRLLDQLNASRTPWISLGTGGDDAAA
jgi:hypothetical protein